jgi:MauM/NapG family ferredoxin protein
MVRWVRRAVQTAFLLLFVYLFFETAYHAIDRAGAHGTLFFQLDPLVAVFTGIAAHAVAAGVVLAVTTLAVTLVFGRWFCGWICPLGTLHHACSTARGAAGYGRWHKAKYVLLAGLIGAALLGVNEAGWLDPIAFLFRSLATAVYPALRPHHFGNVLIGVLFAAALALNVYRSRFWCRYICPLGALLGVVGQRPLLRLVKNAEACNQCRDCLAGCQGGARTADTEEWHPSECFYCLNCRKDCPTSAIRFSWTWQKPARLNLARRHVLAAGVAGVGAALLVRGRPFNAELVRPPGALAEPEFLSRCIRCGECMKVCPTNAIQPTALEAGIAGLWSPVLKMTMGYCEYECTLCTQVCPTGAIRPLTVPEKQKIRIGLAFFDRNRCLPYALARNCIVCEEHCPTPKKAIWFQEARVSTPSGGTVAVKQPYIDPTLCIGCGICVTKCVVKGQPAVAVSSVGETRHPANGLLL